MIPKVKDLRFGSLSCYKTDSFSRFLVQSGQMEIEGDFEGIVKERGANKITNTVTSSDYFFSLAYFVKTFRPQCRTDFVIILIQYTSRIFEC